MIRQRKAEHSRQGRRRKLLPMLPPVLCLPMRRLRGDNIRPLIIKRMHRHPADLPLRCRLHLLPLLPGIVRNVHHMVDLVLEQDHVGVVKVLYALWHKIKLRALHRRLVLLRQHPAAAAKQRREQEERVPARGRRLEPHGHELRVSRRSSSLRVVINEGVMMMGLICYGMREGPYSADCVGRWMGLEEGVRRGETKSRLAGDFYDDATAPHATIDLGRPLS